MISAILSLLSGGVLRLLPEVLSFLDKKQDRQHELAMCDKQMELKKLDASNQIAIASEQHDAGVDIGLLNALTEAQKSQSTVTGIKLVDALNALVRPTITYAIFGMYVIIRFVMIAVAIKANPTAWMPILAASWTESDMSMLNMILGFWFLSRTILSKK